MCISNVFVICFCLSFHNDYSFLFYSSHRTTSDKERLQTKKHYTASSMCNHKFPDDPSQNFQTTQLCMVIRLPSWHLPIFVCFLIELKNYVDQ